MFADVEPPSAARCRQYFTYRRRRFHLHQHWLHINISSISSSSSSSIAVSYLKHYIALPIDSVVKVNSASYLLRDGKWVVAYELRGEDLYSAADWDGGMSASCNRGANCSLTRAMDGRIVRCGIISSCQSAATSEIVKRFWTRVWLM